MPAGLSYDGLRTRFLLSKRSTPAGSLRFGLLRSPPRDVEAVIEGTGPHEVEHLLPHLAPDTTVPPDLAEVPPGLRPLEQAPVLRLAP